jgi:hypothetical protein
MADKERSGGLTDDYRRATTSKQVEASKIRKVS